MYKNGNIDTALHNCEHLILIMQKDGPMQCLMPWKAEDSIVLLWLFM